MTTPTILTTLRRALRTAKARSKVYGKGKSAGYHRQGAVMVALFPKGIRLRTKADFIRYQMLDVIVSKLVRYTQFFPGPGHKDSAHDLGVYGLLLETIDDDESLSHHRR